ncbi:MAG: DEAD/DEAH box helicase [Erysipelotrichaceae bacterium]|nr:DEAD/DEAH box helicase [Erysipelotrichaceae bacterium]
MNKLDPKEIVRNAIDGLTYSKAYDLFLSKKVTLSCHRNELEQDVYEGVVTGRSNKSYPVKAIIDTNGKVVEAACKCDYYLSYPGYCKHILALLLQINEMTNKKEADVLTSLLQIYKKNVSLNIVLTPIFYSYKYETGIEFKIGKDSKKYFVKNIPELYDNIKNNYYYKYGKDLEFMHSMSAFDTLSRGILEDLSDYLNFYSSDCKSYFDGKRKCKIPIIVFKKILDLYINQEIEFVFDEAHFDLLYSSDVPRIELSYNKDTLSLKNRDKMRFFSLGKNHFVMMENKLYCIDNTIHNDLIPLINTLYIRSIEFTTKQYNEFFTYIYPKIKGLINIDNLEEFEKHNNCSLLEAICYLDLQDGCLFLKYDFYYEGMERDEAINHGIYPNIAMEENFSEQLQIFNFIKTTNKNEYIIDSTDEAIEFILSDLESLKEISTVYISDSIKNLKPIKTSGSPIGLRYSNNWLELIFNDNFFNIDELSNVLSSMKKKKKFHLLKDGTILNLQEKFFLDYENIVNSVGLNTQKLNKTMQVSIFKILQLDQYINQKDLPAEAIKFLHDIKNYKNINYPIDKNLVKTLRDYQKEGVLWLMNLTYYRLSGILADDMGLGKTLEIITLLSSVKTKNPNLIVSPSSLTYNWLHEFNKWSSKMDVLLISGNGQTREQLIKQIKPGQTVITSYDYLKRDLEIYKTLSFHFVIIDEAQAIKNYQTMNAEAVKALKCVSRFALTGTPIENSLADLWSIFDFCIPGYLKSYESFKNEYEIEIIKNHNQEKTNALSHQITPFILRRTKEEVLRELPEKTEQVIYATMSDEQEAIYNATLLQARDKLLETSVDNKAYIFSMLTRLRQIVCHPKLYIENYEGDSAKLNLTMDIVYDAIHSSHRVLIFSQFTSMLDLIDKELNKESVHHFKLTGSTPSEERYRLVEEFNRNNNVKVFLISLKAGGTGLNLVGADTVIHYDPWWNLSAENQASDRVHRIGQKNHVQIIKMITKSSIEEKILDLQNAKKELFDKVVGDSTAILSKLTNEELLSLFNISK